MMDDLQVIGGINKLNNNNYNTWTTYMMSYLQVKTFGRSWEESKIAPLEEDTNDTFQKWRIKWGKTKFTLKTTTEEDMLEHIWDNKTLKEAWDMFVTHFSKKNDTRPQLLENE